MGKKNENSPAPPTKYEQAESKAQLDKNFRNNPGRILKTAQSPVRGNAKRGFGGSPFMAADDMPNAKRTKAKVAPQKYSRGGMCAKPRSGKK